MLTALHHVELCVANGKNMVSYFTDKLGFSLRAWRETLFSQQWVVGSQKSTFVVTERKNEAPEHTKTSSSAPFTAFCCSKRHRIDSVFNVALEVKNVESVTERMRSEGGTLFHPVTEVEDDFGKVRYSIVGSCCGNVVHTLLDKTSYRGFFLPTFHEIVSDTIKHEDLITHVDHMTYVCRPGESSEIIRWYEKCLGAEKFVTNRTEDPIEGLVIAEGIGMRLRVMHYWQCAESGIQLPNSDANDGSSLKIVLAESLPDQENSHIGAFLKGHGGPGLQHIGLHAPDITRCVRNLIHNGVLFRKPPAAYYDLEEKVHEIERSGHDLNEFKELGILIDPEADVNLKEGESTESNRFLLQIFTLPIFQEETFFLEVVQRQGARGFGAGNVTALAKSIEQEKKKKSQAAVHQTSL